MGKSKIKCFDFEQLDMSAQRYCARGVLANGIYIIRFYCDEYYDEELKLIGDNNCKLSAFQSSQLSQIIDKILAVPEKYDARDPNVLDGFVGSFVVSFEDGTKRTIFNERAGEIYDYLVKNASLFTYTKENIDFLNKIAIGRYENVTWDFDAFLGGSI